jgi:hypothetical protein
MNKLLRIYGLSHLAVFALLLLSPATFQNCTNSPDKPAPVVPVVDASVPEAPDSLRFCGAISPTLAPKTDRRAVGSPPAYWAQNKVLKIRFLPTPGTGVMPTAAQMDFFKTCVAEIDTLINLSISYVTGTTPADIRVAFSPNASWSHIGSNAQYVNQSQATCNIGWGWNSKNAAGVYQDGVVRHEFLHAIGAQHEQCNVNGGICWNKEVVYADLLASNGWDRATVDHNVFFLCSGSQYQSTTWDKNSVMHYRVIARWTCDNKEIPGNNFLSPTDVSFWSNAYKKSGVVVPPPPPPVTTVTLTATQVQTLMANATGSRDLANDAVLKAQAALNSALAAKTSANNNYNALKTALGQ